MKPKKPKLHEEEKKKNKPEWRNLETQTNQRRKTNQKKHVEDQTKQQTTKKEQTGKIKPKQKPWRRQTPRTQISLMQTVRLKLNPSSDDKGSKRQWWPRQSSRRRFSSNSLFSCQGLLGSLFSFQGLLGSLFFLPGSLVWWWLLFVALKEIDFFTLDLAQQNRLPYARDVSLLNCFKNVLTNKIVWDLVLFWKKSKTLCTYWFQKPHYLRKLKVVFSSWSKLYKLIIVSSVLPLKASVFLAKDSCLVKITFVC